MYQSHHRKSCFEEDIWDYRLPVALSDDFAGYVDDLGGFDAPVPGRPLRRMETERFVLTGTVGKRRLTVRITGADDPDDVRATVEERLDEFLAAQLTE
ncbi:MAG: hypothetical protein ACI8XM_002260 [Haloarculaceae archaeon]|jgi:hypothetical protein